MIVDALAAGTPQIFYDLDNFCVGLYDKFENFIFEDRECYHAERGLIPLWVYHAGHDSDLSTGKDRFNTWVQEISNPRFYQHLFLADCHNLIGSIQNKILATKTQFKNFYKQLDEVDAAMFENDCIYWTTGENTVQVFSSLHDLFITMYASLDLITKLAFQFENMPEDYTKYQKMKSVGILFGHKNRIHSIDINYTIFEENRSIKIIENLRHELIHNGTWESVPKVHYRIAQNDIVEKYIYKPDLTEVGTIEACINRKRFFSKENKINEILPNICSDFWERVLVTLKKISLANY